jgi:hypothetical protein
MRIATAIYRTASGRSESSHPERRLPPDEPTAILILGDLLATLSTGFGLDKPELMPRAAV